MATVPAQQAVVDYHSEMSQNGHHNGHDMYIFHRDWHQQNRDPVPPTIQNRNWGANLVFGTNFLQMHHEMIKAADAERKFHMMHQSLVAWYISKNYDLPNEWKPLEQIPQILTYEPNVNVFPQEIRNAVVSAAERQGVTPTEFLRRRTERPNFALPKYFTRQGVSSGESGDPYTGARKLADFQNTNQLGCCIVFPHNGWHGAIGGAMSSTWTAIADPIFYFGVHWYIDKVFDGYKLLQAERNIRPLDLFSLRASNALESASLTLTRQLSSQELTQRETDIALSRSLRRNLMDT